MQSISRSDRHAALYLIAVDLTAAVMWVVFLQAAGTHLFETVDYLLSAVNPSQGFYVFLAVLAFGSFFLAAAYIWGAAGHPLVALLLLTACVGLAAGCLFYALWPLTFMLGVAGFYAFRGVNGA